MPRKRGPHGEENSKVLAVRVTYDLAGEIYGAAGTTEGAELAEWLRNVLRRAVGHRLNYDAGYAEGKAAGWANAQARLREALKGA